MTWTVPRTWVAGEVPTAAQMNAHIADNLNASTWIMSEVQTSQTTTSTTFADLTTVGPTLSGFNIDTQVTVMVGAQVSNNTVGQHAIMSYVVRNGADSADVIAASDTWMFESKEEVTANLICAGGFMSRQTASLSTGQYVLKAKYRVTGGTGTFLRRWIMAMANGSPT